MSSRKLALIYAGAIVLIAVLAIFDIVPEQLARYSVIGFPALAAIHVIRKGSCGRAGSSCA